MDYPTPYAEGFFLPNQPQGVIMHGSRSGRSGADHDEDQEFIGTARWCQINPQEYAWNATIGERKVALHLPLEIWGVNAGGSSSKYLAVEFTQSREGDPITDDHLLAFAWFWHRRVKLTWPDIPMEFPMHSELPQGLIAGKTDLYPPGAEANHFRERVREVLRLTS